ncbi:MAG TPA: MmgE/PrpD family protein, partial [Thermoplasmataceae archaeon]|nr:MmgE/PrpD family protein [Thermoplasmataceae archaeon]
MDKLAAQIIEHSREVSENNPVPESIDEMKKRIADSLITSYGAKDAEPVKIMSKALLPSSGRLNSPIYFTRNSASVDISSLINGTMTRYLDYNDTYLSKEALHPSDNIPPMLALGYSKDMTGMDVIKSSMVAYDIAAGFSDACSIRDRGWDHVTYISISSAAGLSTLLDLDERKFEHCLNLAINNNISMRQTRAGELSMWKGATAANACRNSVMAAELASEGFTGPSPIFSGEMGFFRQVSGEIFPVFKSNSVLRTMIKNYPVEYHAMSAAEVAVELKGRIEGDIESIEIETFRVAHQIIIKDPEKWRPKTRETADHSMPYIIAYALRYGAPNPDSYSEKYLNDPGILAHMGKMHFKVTERFNAMYPEYLPVKISVKTSKQKIEKEL